jgi:hypothetical protein
MRWIIEEERIKSENRKRRYEEMRARSAQKEEQICALDQMLHVSSGKLAGSNIYCLGAEVRDKMLKDAEDKQKKKDEVDERKREQN